MKDFTLVLPFLIILLVQSVIAQPVQNLNAANELVYNVETGGILGNQVFDTGSTNTCNTHRDRCITDVEKLVNVPGLTNVSNFTLTTGSWYSIHATGGGNGGRFGAATPHTLKYDIKFKKIVHNDIDKNLTQVFDVDGSSACNDNWTLCAQVMSVETGLDFFINPWYDFHAVVCYNPHSKIADGQTLKVSLNKGKSADLFMLSSPILPSNQLKEAH
eukprot:Nk52_evm1s201 gene=Nk52_evmTU1s201